MSRFGLTLTIAIAAIVLLQEGKTNSIELLISNFCDFYKSCLFSFNISSYENAHADLIY